MNFVSMDLSVQTPTFRWLCSGVVMLITLVVYVLTLCPTIAGWDSGELVTVAYTMAVAHPPGYPLYTMIGKLFTLLPFGGENIAWKLNLFSAVSGSLAAGFIFAGVFRWTGYIAAALLAAGLFAFSPLVWRFTVIAEVFAFNNLLVSILFYLSIRFWQERSREIAMLGALVLGLGLSHHHTIVFVGAPLVLWVLYVGGKGLLNPKTFCMLLGLLGLGLLPYLYLPVAAAHNLAESWGDTSTWNGFWEHVFRKEYGSLRLVAHSGEGSLFLVGVKHYFTALFVEVFFIGIPIALVALWSIIRRRRGVGPEVLWFCIWAFYTVVFHYLANLDIRRTDSPGYDIHVRFWMEPNLVFCVLIGWGFAQLIPRFRGVKQVVWITLSLFVITGHAAYSLSKQYQYRNTMIYDFAKQVLDHLPQGAIYLSRGDLEASSLMYLQQSEGYRKDVITLNREILKSSWAYRTIHKLYPDVSFPSIRYDPVGQLGTSGYQLKDFLDANMDKYPIYLSPLGTRGSPEEKDGSWKTDYQIFPVGVVYKVFRLEQFDWLQAMASSREQLEQLPPPDPLILPKYGFEYDAWERYYAARNWLGAQLITMGIQEGNKMMLIEAINTLESLVELHPEPRDFYFKNLGIAYQHLQGADPENKIRMILAWQKYINSYRGDPEDPAYQIIRRIVEKATGSEGVRLGSDIGKPS
ncbi:DUF2723 domain-containing protein [Pseudomonadota bacterium]